MRAWLGGESRELHIVWALGFPIYLTWAVEHDAQGRVSLFLPPDMLRDLRSGLQNNSLHKVTVQFCACLRQFLHMQPIHALMVHQKPF